MRILVGTVEIAGMIPVFANGFRRLGHKVTTVISARHPFYNDLHYDVNLSTDILRLPNAIQHSESRVLEAIKKGVCRSGRLVRLLGLIASHDIFMFQWAGSSLRWQSEYPLLKMLGKRIVSVCVGDDVRHALSYSQEAALFYTPEQFSFILSPDHCERLEHDPLARPLRSMRMEELYSDLILSVPSNSGLAVRPYNHFFVPIDLSVYRKRVPERERPVVVHAPSHKGVKGTQILLPVLEQLKAEDVPFEFRLLHGMAHSEVINELMNADAVIDQLFFPLHGKLSLEAMATGCAVATSNREDYEPFPPNRPIWHVDPGNLYTQLKRLLTDKGLRVRLAHQGREYVERYHDHVNVAGRIVDRLCAGEAQQYDHYPTFYAQRFNLPEGVVVPDDLQRMTAHVVQRWGIPEGLDPQDMIRRGLICANALKQSKPIPRWKTTSSSAEATIV